MEPGDPLAHRTILDCLEEPVFVVDAAFRIRYANAAAREAYGRLEDPLGRTCHAVTHRTDDPCPELGLACPVHEVFATGQRVRLVHQHLRSDGSTVWEEIVASPIRGPRGEVVEVVEEIRSVDEVLHMREVIADLESQLEELREGGPAPEPD